MRMTESILDEFGIRDKTHVINTDNGPNIRRAMLDMAEAEIPTREMDINMNDQGVGRANEVIDEFLPEPITDQLNGETCPTIHMVLPTIKDIKNHIFWSGRDILFK